MKEGYGCERDSNMGERWTIGQYKLKRCPLKEITQEGLEYIQAYKFYKNGLLPIPGGWINQAQPFIEAMGIIETEVTKADNQIIKERQR